MAVGSATRQETVFGLLVGLGARASGRSRSALAHEVAEAVAAHFTAAAVSIHASAEGWAEAVADPRGVLSRASVIDRARVETLDARLVEAALRRDRCVSALDLDRDLTAETYLGGLLGTSDVFAVPLRAAGRPAGVVVLYLDARSTPPSDSDLFGLGGVGEVLALAGEPPHTSAPAALAAPPARPLRLLRRLFAR